MRKTTALARRRVVAQEVARCDAQVLGHLSAGPPWVQSRRAGAARRVVEVGTPTWWAGQGGDVEGRCPLRAVATTHQRRSAGDPRCRWCALMLGQAEPIDRAALGEQVWEQVARHYGLSRQQVSASAQRLGDLVDVRRGLAVTEPAARISVAATDGGQRLVVLGATCQHICTGADPVCWHCGAVVGQVQVMSRRELAEEVWRKITHRHGLSKEQTASAVDELADLINTRRGLTTMTLPTST